jgi:mono/diheme cytochrome c family protein
MSRFTLLTLVLAPLVGCVAALPHATEADAARVSTTFPNASVSGLEHGRSLYVARCAGCHELREPASETPLAWPHLVAEMRDEHGVHLTSDEEQGIVAYLVSVSAR